MMFCNIQARTLATVENLIFVHLLYVFSPFIRTTVVLMAKQRMRQIAVFATKAGQATGATFHSHQLLRHRPLMLIT